jgi:hypothetical protein
LALQKYEADDQAEASLMKSDVCAARTHQTAGNNRLGSGFTGDSR